MLGVPFQSRYQALEGKNGLTSQNSSDIQHGNQALFVYNSKCGSGVGCRRGLIEGGFGYG